MNAAAPRIVENFLDVAHFPFVHENYLGIKNKAEINDYNVVTSKKGIDGSFFIASGLEFHRESLRQLGSGAKVE